MGDGSDVRRKPIRLRNLLPFRKVCRMQVDVHAAATVVPMLLEEHLKTPAAGTEELLARLADSGSARIGFLSTHCLRKNRGRGIRVCGRD